MSCVAPVLFSEVALKWTSGEDGNSKVRVSPFVWFPVLDLWQWSQSYRLNNLGDVDHCIENSWRKLPGSEKGEAEELGNSIGYWEMLVCDEIIGPLGRSIFPWGWVLPANIVWFIKRPTQLHNTSQTWVSYYSIHYINLCSQPQRAPWYSIHHILSASHCSIYFIDLSCMLCIAFIINWFHIAQTDLKLAL